MVTDFTNTSTFMQNLGLQDPTYRTRKTAIPKYALRYAKDMYTHHTDQVGDPQIQKKISFNNQNVRHLKIIYLAYLPA